MRGKRKNKYMSANMRFVLLARGLSRAHSIFFQRNHDCSENYNAGVRKFKALPHEMTRGDFLVTEDY